MNLKHIAFGQLLGFGLFALIALMFLMVGSDSGVRTVGTYMPIVMAFVAAATFASRPASLTTFAAVSIGLAGSAFVFQLAYALAFDARLGPALGLGSSAIASASIFTLVYIVGFWALYLVCIAARRR